MKLALVADGAVVDVVEPDPATTPVYVPPDGLQVIVVPDDIDVAPGWQYAAGSFTESQG